MLTAVTHFAKPTTVTTMPLSTPDLSAITTTMAIHRGRVSDAALDFQRHANEVCWEMYLYHRQQPDFRATYKSARQLWDLAGQIHDAAHRGSESDELIPAGVGELRRLLRDIVDDVAVWSTTAVRSIPTPGHARLMRRGGMLKTLQAKLRALEELQQELAEDALSPACDREESSPHE